MPKRRVEGGEKRSWRERRGGRRIATERRDEGEERRRPEESGRGWLWDVWW